MPYVEGPCIKDPSAVYIRVLHFQFLWLGIRLKPLTLNLKGKGPLHTANKNLKGLAGKGTSGRARVLQHADHLHYLDKLAIKSVAPSPHLQHALTLNPSEIRNLKPTALFDLSSPITPFKAPL